jgi:phosphomannomutase
MVSSIVISTLAGMGCDVVNIGLATTPTTELAVTGEQANGGIILTASHNPKQWNALKLLGSNGEFLNAAEGEKILKIAESEDFVFAEVDDLGTVTEKDYLEYHVQHVLNLKLVDVDAIKKAGFSVAVDAVSFGNKKYCRN